jgi:AraC family transcriptional regulator of adaptative response / DNA-3-methyladenine glycosylase II
MLTYRPPYDWDGLLEFLAARAIPGVESVADGAYHRVVRAGDGLGTIAVRHRPRERALELELAHADALATFAIVSRVRALFDLAADPAPIRRALGADPVLAPAVAARPGLRLPGAFDPFELAVRAVLGQQVSVAAARTLAARLVARCGERLDPTASGDEPQLTRAFPTAQALASANLDGLGITGARVESVRALASAWRDGRIDVTSDPQALRSTLAVLPGMGPWTREIIALRAGGDPDAFPAGDLGLRKALGRGVPLSESALTARAEAWRPWRGYAVFYLWTLLAPDPPRRRRGRPARRSRG